MALGPALKQAWQKTATYARSVHNMGSLVYGSPYRFYGALGGGLVGGAYGAFSGDDRSVANRMGGAMLGSALGTAGGWGAGVGIQKLVGMRGARAASAAASAGRAGIPTGRRLYAAGGGSTFRGGSGGMSPPGMPNAGLSLGAGRPIAGLLPAHRYPWAERVSAAKARFKSYATRAFDYEYGVSRPSSTREFVRR